MQNNDAREILAVDDIQNSLQTIPVPLHLPLWSLLPFAAKRENGNAIYLGGCDLSIKYTVWRTVPFDNATRFILIMPTDTVRITAPVTASTSSSSYRKN